MSTVEIPPGKSAAGCAGCNEVFTCVSAFDRHQTLADGKNVCHDPSERGLVVHEREVKGEIWSLWGWPSVEKGDGSWFAAD